VPSRSETPVIAIVGPTASGKSTLGIEVALKLNGEIINCDSVQIYRDIQIATAKPSADEMRGVPHHLIGYVPADVNYTAADWARDAAAKIVEIESRGNVPVLVGGTGFYLRTLRRPLFDSPETDQQIREKIRVIQRKHGKEFIHKMLNRVDPAAAGKLFPGDHIRVTRALEVFFQTGKRISDQQPERAEPPEFAGRIRIFVLNPPRAELYERINERTSAHFAAGLVEEVEALREKGIPDDKNALGAHGYRRVCEYLRGERSLESAVERTRQDVRNYAKRQLTWFRSEKDAIWLDGFGDDPSVFPLLLVKAGLD
jgi:tRNA dimethylallyltransferase